VGHVKGVTTPSDRLSRFLEHLDGIFQREPTLYPFESTVPGAPKLVTMVYRDVPEPEHVTGVTYGLSEVAHADWKFGRPELLVSLQSTDIAWPLAVAELANQLRGRCPFCYGNVINFGAPISDESEMSAFFIFTPSILERDDFLNIDVGGPQPINIAGMYPIYDSERAKFAELGFESFWHHPNFDLYDVRRPRVNSAVC
jgi:hypothetical protein